MKPMPWPEGSTHLYAKDLQQGLMLLLSYSNHDYEYILKVENGRFRVIGYTTCNNTDGSPVLTNPGFMHTKTLQIIERSDLPLLINFKGEFRNLFLKRDGST